MTSPKLITPICGQDLTPESLMQAASAQTGLDDWGDPSFVEPMTKWLESMVAEGNLSAAGEVGVHSQAMQTLVNRLRLQDDVNTHPEILEEDLSDPIIITGLLRTGTSKLQRVMSRDPGVQRAYLWRLMNPAPIPGHASDARDPRIDVADQYVRHLAVTAPDFQLFHTIEAEEVDEETYLLGHVFDGFYFSLITHAPSLYRWWLERPRQGTYDYLRLQLQYLQWQDGGKRGRPWVLKSPLHLGHLENLAQTFPNATIVHCHRRDVSRTMASCLGFTELARRMLCADVNRVEFGAEQLDIWDHEMKRYLRQRDELGEQVRIVDVPYDDIVADPIAVVRTIYNEAGRELTDAAERAMAEWNGENPQYRHGKLDHSLDKYGLTRERVEAAFSGYIDRFAGMVAVS